MSRGRTNSSDYPLKKPVDREGRDRVVSEFRRFLNEETTAASLDGALFEVKTKDRTLIHIRTLLWCNYDDFTDHFVTLSKEQWDYCQRLLLILKSDAHFETTRRRWLWDKGQLVALFALGVCVSFLFCIGVSALAFAVTIPLGVLSMAIAKYRDSRSMPDQSTMALMPFSSLTELRTVYRSVGDFRKSRYPQHLEKRRVRSAIMQQFLILPTYVFWLSFSPLFLFFQMLPSRESQRYIVIV